MAKTCAELNVVEDDTFKADDELSDSDDDVMLSSLPRNFQADEAALSLSLSDAEESDFLQFLGGRG